jgi:transcriptional regulator with XRE-family HTH domain
VGLREFRKERSLSLEAVSVLAGIDIATLSRVERGLQRPRPDTVVRLARGLGVAARRMQTILEESSEPVGA